MKKLIALLLFAPIVFAATGFDYPNPTTLRLFNEGSLKPFCINTTSGIALENCGFDWADTTWCVASRRNANPWAQTCTNGTGMTYRVASDNLTYANATFQVPLSGGHVFILNYNLTRYASFIDVQPNFTTGASVPSNTSARFQILQRNININDTLANNLLYFDNKTYNLSQGGTNNTDNTTDERTLAIYRPDDNQQIFYGWFSPYNTKLDVWPQAGYANRQLNLTFEFGTVAARRSYVVPLKWADLEVACDVGTHIFSVSSSTNTSNGTSKNRINITANVFKSGFGNCVYYLYQKLTAAGKPGLMPSSETVNSINLPVGFVTGGTVNPFSTSAISYRWTVQIGGMNGTNTGGQYTNLTYQINVSGVSDTSGNEQNFKQLAVWDTRPPNATINTTNFTNYTLGVIYIHAWANDETNLKVIELRGNETGVWKFLTSQNASSGAINKSFFFNFSRPGLAAGCYLYQIRAMDTTLDFYNNKYNETQNITLCVNSSGIVVAGRANPTIQYAVPNWRKYELEETTVPGKLDNWYFVLAVCLGVTLVGLLMARKGNLLKGV